MKIRATLVENLGDVLHIRQYAFGPNHSLSLKRAILRLFNKTCCSQVITRVQLHLVIHSFTFLSNLDLGPFLFGFEDDELDAMLLPVPDMISDSSHI